MPTFVVADFMWWLTAVQLPVLAGLFRLVQQGRARTEAVERATAERMGRLREDLAAYKLDVARTYASLSYLKEVETRLTDHLVRIEAKLDRAAPSLQHRAVRP